MRGELGLKSLNLSMPRDARLKSRPIPIPPSLRDGKNPWGETQV